MENELLKSEIITENQNHEGYNFGMSFNITNNKIEMRYYDETWGSFRHWQIVDSLKEVESIEEAEKIINSKEKRDDFKVCWEFEVVKKDFNDSRKNRHRSYIYQTDVSKGIYLLRRWVRYHPSGNSRRYLSGFIFVVIQDGKIVKIVDKRIKGL